MLGVVIILNLYPYMFARQAGSALGTSATLSRAGPRAEHERRLGAPPEQVIESGLCCGL